MTQCTSAGGVTFFPYADLQELCGFTGVVRIYRSCAELGGFTGVMRIYRSYAE